mgnify:CR=1 FL=1
MKELKLRKLWLLIGFIYIVVIFYLCLRRSTGTIPSFPHIDKIIHFTAYFIMMSYFCQILNKSSYKVAFIIFVLMGVLIEFLQLMTGYRSFEFLDMMANTSGLLMGWLIFGNYFSNVLKNIESFLKFKNS